MLGLGLAEPPLRYEMAAAAPRWLAEPAAEPLNESELSWIWRGQRYPAGALQLVDGRSLQVISPGRQGGGSGPDYLDAVIEIGGARLRGDVELHVRASGFRAHGHDRDAAYNGVALHVVFRADDGASTRLSCGSEAPVAALAPWLEGRTSELQGWLSAEAAWREPCRDAVARLGEPGVRAVLREAGRQRFAAKAAALRTLAEELGEEEALWRSLLDLLGTGGDRDGFRRLAAAFPAGLAREITNGRGAAEAELALAGGLGYVAGVGGSEIEGLTGLPAPLRPALGQSGRPANRPAVRLAGLAVLYVASGGDLAGWVRRGVAAAATAKGLVTAWQVSRQGRALIGGDRARELVLNLALPFAAGDAALSDRAAGLAEGLGTAPPYGKTAFLEANLLPQSGRRLTRQALEQQGLLAFVGQWCSQGGCGRCPLS